VTLRGLVLGIALFAVPAFAGGEQKMVFKVEHHWSLTDARNRTQMLVDYWKKAYGVQATWQGDRVYVKGRVIGVDIDAYIDVQAGSVGGEGLDPGPLMRGFARDYVQKKLEKYMHPEYREP
jgi:hypothetical protein